MQLSILENYKVKLFALFAATIFWFAIVTENSYQYEFDVDIVPVNLPADRLVMNELPKKARVRFEGQGKALLALHFSHDARIELDLSNVGMRARIKLARDMLHIPRRGHAVDRWSILYPDTIYVEFSRLLQKTVPIIPHIEVIPANGYTTVGDVVLSPDSVLIAGPRKYVKDISQVFTKQLQLRDARFKLHGRVPLHAFPDSMKIELSAKHVDYTVDVQKLLELQIDEVPVEVINVPPGWKITPIPSTLSMTIAGGEKLLMELRRDDLKAYIDYSKPQRADLNGHPAYIETPPEIAVISVHPQLFKLEREKPRTRR